jgi:hypothetical protein
MPGSRTILFFLFALSGCGDPPVEDSSHGVTIEDSSALAPDSAPALQVPEVLDRQN